MEPSLIPHDHMHDVGIARCKSLQVSPDISRWEKKNSEVLRVTRLIGGA